MIDQEDTLEQMVDLCEGKTWEELGDIFGAVLKRLVPSPSVLDERLREHPSTRKGLWTIARVMVEGCIEEDIDNCVHPYGKVYESEEVEGRVICMACNEVLIDSPPAPEVTASGIAITEAGLDYLRRNPR